MIKRLYIHNFRCLENFELPIAGLPSCLLIGNNGSGKSTIGFALEILQKIARGSNHVGDLVQKVDFGFSFPRGPMRFEIELEIDQRTFEYHLALELSAGENEPHVCDERLSCDGADIYWRDVTQLNIAKSGTTEETQAPVSLQLVALPLVPEYSESDPLRTFKNWLAKMLILSPMPSRITGDASGAELTPNREVTNFGDWYTGLVGHSRSAKSQIENFIRQVDEDFLDINSVSTGEGRQSLYARFKKQAMGIELNFASLSDGEKCFFIGALVLASNTAFGPLLCFWDEPDNFVSPSEVGYLVMALRREFENHGGQLIITSHNPEAIRQFPYEKTLFFFRKSHVEPTEVHPISELEVYGDLVGALIRNDVEP
ncbi:MAG: AAA family ATPase [Planctomycetaceae bacterium]